MREAAQLGSPHSVAGSGGALWGRQDMGIPQHPPVGQWGVLHPPLRRDRWRAARVMEIAADSSPDSRHSPQQLWQGPPLPAFLQHPSLAGLCRVL